jgi:hypothetical protein
MASEPEILRERGRNLEAEFFRPEDAPLVERVQQAARRESAREAMARASGIKNPEVLDRLIDLGINPQIVTALSLVPLVEVAWADRMLDLNERRAVLARMGATGFAPGSLQRAVLEVWLTRRPAEKLFAAWAQLVRGLCAEMDRSAVAALKAGLLDQARAVAGASGDNLGLQSTVSGVEMEVIRRLDSAFPPDG